MSVEATITKTIASPEPATKKLSNPFIEAGLEGRAKAAQGDPNSVETEEDPRADIPNYDED